MPIKPYIYAVHVHLTCSVTVILHPDTH